MIVKTLEVGPFATNCHLVFVEENKHLYIIDPGDDGERIVAEAKKFDYEKVELFLTHFHIDHINAVEYCAKELNSVRTSLAQALTLTLRFALVLEPLCVVRKQPCYAPSKDSVVCLLPSHPSQLVVDCGAVRPLSTM